MSVDISQNNPDFQAIKTPEDEPHDHHDYDGDTLLGFWMYILSDCILFATLFAVYAVLAGSYADSPAPATLIDLKLVFVETGILLASSFTFGLAMLAMVSRDIETLKKWLWITFGLGAVFLAIELYEFAHLTHAGAGFDTSASWSAFFALVGTHGLHVLIGLIWMLVLFVHLKRDGLSKGNIVRLSCLSIFWHFLDVIWICVFSMVYLMGALS